VKVFFLTGSLEIGGAQQQLVTLARGLARRGHIVGVILFYPGGSLADGLESHGVTLYDIGKRSRWDLLGPFVRLVRLLRAEDPDLLYAFMGSANVAAALAGLFVRGVKIVFGVRCSNMDWSKYDVMSRVVTSLQAWLSPLAHFFIVNSKAGLIATRASGISIPGSVIANGIDTSRFRPDAVARAEWRRRLNVNDTTLLIGMLARRDPMKDHEGFLSAAKMITTVRSDVAFILAGPGVDRSDQILSQLADEVGAPVYLLGACAQPERLLAAWDVSVLASRFGEGFPNVVGEAMACGLPCVVTDVGDSGLILGATGRLVPRGDPKELAEAILDTLADADARRDMGIAARRRIEDKFALSVVITKYDALYSRLLEGELAT
jgi:glycosyltransferase involved in cell wall biosynthesis